MVGNGTAVIGKSTIRVEAAVVTRMRGTGTNGCSGKYPCDMDGRNGVINQVPGEEQQQQGYDILPQKRIRLRNFEHPGLFLWDVV